RRRSRRQRLRSRRALGGHPRTRRCASRGNAGRARMAAVTERARERGRRLLHPRDGAVGGLGRAAPDRGTPLTRSFAHELDRTTSKAPMTAITPKKIERSEAKPVPHPEYFTGSVRMQHLVAAEISSEL